MTSKPISRKMKSRPVEGVKFPPIVCVGFPRWEGSDYLSSTVQLMGELAKTDRVLYVDYPFTYKDLVDAHLGNNPGVPAAELRGTAPRLQPRTLANGATLQLLRLPPFVPANFLNSPVYFDRINQWNARRAGRAILAALKKLGWEQPIVINAFNPALGNMLAGTLNESLLVYYCYDEISAAFWIARHGTRHERTFLQRADLTIVSSTGLYGAKFGQAKNCALVKNGVDLSLFKSQGTRPGDLPWQPIMGYIGTVDDRLDFELLEALAQAYPSCTLVFVGRVLATKQAAQLARFPNVHLLGPRPAATLGDYLAAFKLGLIPFVKNDLTAGIYPLKINEYLALGLPVVATDFADLSDFIRFLQVGTTTSGFIAATGAILATENTADANARRAFAQLNSWTGRALEMRRLLHQEWTKKQT